MVDPRFYELVAHLWRNGVSAYYWTPDTDEGKLSFWFPAGRPKDVSPLWKSINVYFGVHPSSIERGHRERALIEHIAAVNCLFAEFDLAPGQTPEHLLQSIMQIDTPPSVVVFSGGGYHCYWLLAQTYHIDDEAARLRIIEIQYAWADFVGSDGAAKDLARVLRVPGTYNRKPERGPKFPLVEFVHFDMDTTYELDELAKQVEAIIDTNRAKKVTAASVDVVPVDFDDQTILERMWQKDAASAALWAGDMTAYNDDHSAADMALCSKLAFWFGRDPERIDRVFRRSNLYRPKWLRDDYRARTIDKAIAGCQNTYTGVPTDLGGVNDLVTFTQPQAATNGHTAPPNSTPPTPRLIAYYLLNEGIHDEGNAQCVHKRYEGRFLHSDSFGWMRFTGTHWAISEAESAVERAITETLIARMQEAIKVDPNKYSDLIRKTVPNSGKVKGGKAQLESLVSVSEDMFDVQPDFLNCSNGLVDLRTGSISSHSPVQRFMHCTAVPYNPSADQTPWVSWLNDAVGGVDIAFWLKLAVGYSLTGHTSEEVLFYLYGPPRSGKGTFTETLLALLSSPLAKEINFATFTAQRTGDSQNFDLAPLKPCRFLAASESNTYERFNEAKVKALTGGNEIYCAYKHRTHFSYRPQFKIWLSSNQPVNADPDDDAVWGRIRVVEFPRSHLGAEDKGLKFAMRSPDVLAGVLAWAVEGAMIWYQLGKTGLIELPASAKTKHSQRVELDNVQAWIEEKCELKSSHFSTNSELYPCYFDWCKLNGITAKQQKAFSQSLKRKGFQDKIAKRNNKMVRGYEGIKVN